MKRLLLVVLTAVLVLAPRAWASRRMASPFRLCQQRMRSLPAALEMLDLDCPRVTEAPPLFPPPGSLVNADTLLSDWPGQESSCEDEYTEKLRFCPSSEAGSLPYFLARDGLVFCLRHGVALKSPGLEKFVPSLEVTRWLQTGPMRVGEFLALSPRSQLERIGGAPPELLARASGATRSGRSVSVSSAIEGLVVLSLALQLLWILVRSWRMGGLGTITTLLLWIGAVCVVIPNFPRPPDHIFNVLLAAGISILNWTLIEKWAAPPSSEG